MTFEELKKEFQDNGARFEDDKFIIERDDHSRIIQGRPARMRITLKYICEGYICDEGESDGETLYQFDVLGQGDVPVLTICISSFDDFVHLV